MHNYAFSFPADRILESAWQQALAESPIGKIEMDCDDYFLTWHESKKIVATFKAMQDDGKITVSSAHIPFGANWHFADTDEYLRKLSVDFTKRAPLDIRLFTLHTCLEPMLTEASERGKCMAAFRRTLEELLPMVHSMGFSLNVEDLPRSCLGNTPEELKSLVDGFPAENIGVCYDVNHFGSSPSQIVPGIDLLADRIRAFHLSDYDGADECHWAPGLGIIDWAGVMAAIDRLPRQPQLTFEFSGFLKTNGRDEHKFAWPKAVVHSYEKVVFFLENAAELQERCRKLWQ